MLDPPGNRYLTALNPAGNTTGPRSIVGRVDRRLIRRLAVLENRARQRGLKVPSRTMRMRTREKRFVRTRTLWGSLTACPHAIGAWFACTCREATQQLRYSGRSSLLMHFQDTMAEACGVLDRLFSVECVHGRRTSLVMSPEALSSYTVPRCGLLCRWLRKGSYCAFVEACGWGWLWNGASCKAFGGSIPGAGDE